MNIPNIPGTNGDLASLALDRPPKRFASRLLKESKAEKPQDVLWVRLIQIQEIELKLAGRHVFFSENATGVYLLCAIGM